MRIGWVAAADVAVVVGFVAIGRSTHAEGNPLLAVAATAAPFLLALLVGWAIVVSRRDDPAAVRSGVIVWAVTWVLGLVLRGALFGGGLAPGFIVVAGGTLLLGLVGWRAVAGLVRRRTTRRTPPGQGGPETSKHPAA